MSALLQNWKDVCAGFIGQRLAIYDDLQQGIVRTPTAETQADFDWLVAALLIVRDASTDRWRARAMATVQGEWEDLLPARPLSSEGGNTMAAVSTAPAINGDVGVGHGPTKPTAQPEVRDASGHFVSENPEPARPVTSTLRTPSACPRQPSKGQLALFGN